MGPVWHCYHLVGERKLGCCLIAGTGGPCLALLSHRWGKEAWLLSYCCHWWVLSGIVITSLGKGSFVAVLLLSLIGPVWHCNQLIGERKLGCCLITVTGGPCLAVWSPRWGKEAWLLSYCCHWLALSGIVITLLGKGSLVAVLLLPLVGPVRHCHHLVGERKLSCCLIVVTGDHLVWERRLGCCLIVVNGGSCLAL